jgi:hypothetical protein
MRLVQGELPVQRYAGLHRSIGPQYVRGISKWSDDGSRAGENVMWLVYSMNKEDIWVSRVPLSPDEGAWNFYSPKWAPATVEGDEVRLEDHDPYDYASATRVLQPARDIAVTFDVLAEQNKSPLHIIFVTDNGTMPMTVTPDRVGEWKSHEMRLSSLRRATFQTKPPRWIGGAHPVEPGSDRPQDAVVLRIRNLRITPK